MPLRADLTARYEALRSLERERWHYLANFLQAAIAGATAGELTSMDEVLAQLTQQADQRP